MPAWPLEDARVPGFLRFTADDYRSYAQACRAAAVQAENDAIAQSNPQTARLFNDSARRFRELAEKAELAARVL